MTQANFSETKLLEKIKNLSIDYQKLVTDFVEFLDYKQKQNQLLKKQSVASQKEDDKLYCYGSLLALK